MHALARWLARRRLPFNFRLRPIAVVALGLLVTLRAGAAPANDNFFSATRITGLTNFVVSNAGATAENLEPAHAGNPPFASLWWLWTAPYTGTFCVLTSNSQVNAQTQLDTAVAVYTGSALSTVGQVVANDDTDFGDFGSLWSRVVFRAYAGETFRIAVDSLGQTGDIRLQITRGGPLMPAWQVPGLDGTPVYSSNYAGRCLLIDFWETTCAACIEELGDLRRIQDVYRPDGFTFLGLSGDPSPALVTEYLASHPMNYPIAMSTPALQTLLNGSGVSYPTKFLIDQTGHVVGTYLGGNTYKYYRSILDPILRADSRPRLQIIPSPSVPNSMRVSWPSAQASFSLQSGRSPAGPWFPVDAERVLQGPEVSVTVPHTNPASFYRLVGR